jgi:hypothetical protein
MKFSRAKSYVKPESRFSIYCYRIHVFLAERPPFTVFHPISNGFHVFLAERTVFTVFWPPSAMSYEVFLCQGLN